MFAGRSKTLYVAAQDGLLAIAAQHHNSFRAGQAWSPPYLARIRRPHVIMPGVDSIDCTGDISIADI